MTSADYALIALALRRAFFIVANVHRDDQELKANAQYAITCVEDMLEHVLASNNERFRKDLFQEAVFEPLNEIEKEELMNLLTDVVERREI